MTAENRTEEAIAQLKRATELRPDYSPAHLYLGPMRRGPSVIIDRFLIDDVPIGSNP